MGAINVAFLLPPPPPKYNRHQFLHCHCHCHCHHTDAMLARDGAAGWSNCRPYDARTWQLYLWQCCNTQNLLARIRANRNSAAHAHQLGWRAYVETCTDSHVKEDVICALGVVCHDISVRGDQRFCNLGLAVFRWRFGPSREAFSVDVPHKKILWREPRGGPPNKIGRWVNEMWNNILLEFTPEARQPLMSYPLYLSCRLSRAYKWNSWGYEPYNGQTLTLNIPPAKNIFLIIRQKTFLEENKERGNGPVTSPTEEGSGGHPPPGIHTYHRQLQKPGRSRFHLLSVRCCVMDRVQNMQNWAQRVSSTAPRTWIWTRIFTFVWD